MADLYTFISAADVTVFLPPNSSSVQHQVTAKANQSGVVYAARFIKQDYANPTYVAEYLNGLANGFNGFANVPGVDSISTFQETDANNQLLDKTSVEIISTSGRSSTVITSFYPTVEFQNVVLQTFEGVVSATVAQLDAVEAA